MHPRLQRQIRVLDAWEREFLAAVRKLLQARVDALEPVVMAALESGGEKVIEKLGRLRALPGDYLPLLERYVGHVLVEGMVQGRSDVEFLRSRLQRRGVRLAARVDGEPVVPEGAIDFIRHRRDLGRFFEQDQVDTVRTILDNGLQQGASVGQVMDALQTALPDAIGKARAENIARTEATTAFNRGRLEAFRETKGFVAAVEFMAITDARTTPICTERDGLVLAIHDPDLPANTPPLHYMCRSVLSPVSEFELEDLGGKAYLAKQRDQLEKMPAPLKGFGNEPGLEGGRPPGQPPVVRTPSGPKGTAGGEEARGLEPARQTGSTARGEHLGSLDKPSNPPSEYPIELPGRADVKRARDDAVSGNQTIQIRRFWPGRGERELVRQAIRALPPAALDGLEGISFVGTRNQQRGLGGPRGTASARYYPRSRWVLISRVGGVVFDDQATSGEHREALEAVVHELSHHAFSNLTPEERIAWRALHPGCSDWTPRQRLEQFADELAWALVNRERLKYAEMLYPGVENFLRKVLVRWHAQ